MRSTTNTVELDCELDKRKDTRQVVLQLRLSCGFNRVIRKVFGSGFFRVGTACNHRLQQGLDSGPRIKFDASNTNIDVKVVCSGNA